MELGSIPLIGIALAVGSAIVLSLGNLMQAKGVRAMEAGAAQGGTGSKAMNLFRNQFWLLGAVLLLIAILLQMGSLAFAPLIVVQPVGVTALVFTVLVTALIAKKAPSGAVLRSIAICVVGVAAFVTVAALVSTQKTITDGQLVAVLAVLLGVLVAAALMLVLGKDGTIKPVVWVFLGGVFSAFVATLGKTVILRIQTAFHTHTELTLDLTNLLTLGCIIGIGVAGVLSVYFVQRAHATNRPEVVVAGLTVIDPAVAVVLGITILGEASNAPPWAIVAFLIAGGVAVSGVFALSKAEQAPVER